jgi:hypothetical protein
MACQGRPEKFKSGSHTTVVHDETFYIIYFFLFTIDIVKKRKMPAKGMALTPKMGYPWYKTLMIYVGLVFGRLTSAITTGLQEFHLFDNRTEAGSFCRGRGLQEAGTES